MEKLFFALLFSFSTLFNAQKYDLKSLKTTQTLVVMNNTIASWNILKNMDVKQIKSITVFKEVNMTEELQALKAHAKNGILKVELKNKLKEKSSKLLKFNIKNGLPTETPVYVDGFLVSDNSYKILNKAVVEQKITETNSGKILNLWTMKEEHQQLLPPRDPKQRGIQTVPKDRPVYIKQIQ